MSEEEAQAKSFASTAEVTEDQKIDIGRGFKHPRIFVLP